MRETLAIEDPDISTHAPRTGSDAGVCRKRHGDGISTHAPRTGSDPPIFRGQAVLIYFNPRSPHGERPPFRRLVRPLRGDFNPRSPHGERPPASGRGRRCSGISTHAPRTGSDVVVKVPICRAAISTHAPRTGSDHAFGTAIQLGDISTHAPRTGSDSAASVSTFASNVFQPTLPARGATLSTKCSRPDSLISTHAPRTGSDRYHFFRRLSNVISTHAPRTGSDARDFGHLDFDAISTHAPRTGSDARDFGHLDFDAISTHAPRTGSDAFRGVRGPGRRDFNPRSPHGERPQISQMQTSRCYFNPRSPHGERHHQPTS